MDYSALTAEELVVACRQAGEAAAWQEFVHRFHRLVATVALRVARRWGECSPQLIDDLVQETYLKLCSNNFKLLRSFKPHHQDAFYGYLKVVTANLVHDHFKAAHSFKRGSGAVEVTTDLTVAAVTNASSATPADERSERGILLGELDVLLCKLAAGPQLERDRRIFWLYYRVGLAASAIAALPSTGLSTKGVESTILRLTRLLRKELAKDRPRWDTTKPSS
jgi:RNA polymerase sigma-70 factor (ECF subfamily)